MIVNNDLQFTGDLSRNNIVIDFYISDGYKNSLSLIRGLMGGGYIGSTLYSNITKLQFSTDAWSTSSNSLTEGVKYGGWASSHIRGYVLHSQRDSRVTNNRVQFSTEAVASIGNRSQSGASMSSFQEGVGFDNDGALFGLASYHFAFGNGYQEKLTFSSESWTSSAPSGVMNSADGVGWFDKQYGFAYTSAANTTTYRMPFSTGTWGTVSTTNNPGGLGMPGSGAEKGVNSKEGKFYLAGNWGGSYCGSSAGNRIFRFTNYTHVWAVNGYEQTRWNNEHAGTMGQNWGYFAGGYNCTDSQNAHTDKIFYGTDTIRQIPDAPRQLSSASPMWSPI